MMDEGLLNWLAEVKDDPLAFTLGAYPWGEPGTVLEAYNGPDEWSVWFLGQVRDGLLDTTEAIQLAIASGHGIGKSATVAWLILWAMTTFPDTRGVVTANTETQLKTKTWAELGKWFNLCFFARDHFNLTATALMSKDPSRERTWRIDMIPWSEKNTEAFAGLHNKGKRLILIMDEASAIPDIIHETAEGALTDADTQIIWAMFGNPTRNSGRFKEAFAGGRHAEFWTTRQIDSRSVKVTNKSRFEKWIKVYGEDSDFVRIRVLGQFPRQGEMEFFTAADIDEAMNREEFFVDAFTPLAIGVDVARYGANNSVIFPRKGRDARSIERRRYSGINTVELANRVFDIFAELHPDGIFIDEGGVGGGVVDQCRQKRLHVIGVQFGGKDDISGVAFDTAGEKYSNKRSAMAGATRAWMRNGGALPLDPELRTAMLAITYTINKRDEIALTSKEDIMNDHPNVLLDDLDALFCTFGGPLSRNAFAGGVHKQPDAIEYEYDPFSPERMVS